MTELPPSDVDFLELGSRLEQIYSKRIALRPASLCDAWPLYVATRNPSFNRHLLWPQPDTEDEVLQRLHNIVNRSRSGRYCAMTASVRHSGEFLGVFRFIPSSLGPECVEMGIWMHDKFWHGRYGLELGRLCVSAAFSMAPELGVLVGATYPENRGSKALMTAVGMTPGRMVVRDTEKGPPVALEEYTISRAEWQAQHRTAFEEFRPPLPKVAQQVHDSETPDRISIVAATPDAARQSFA
jgi:RimJ/RimL family protein N-acetyltransferase